jgi:hypothetical protein
LARISGRVSSRAAFFWRKKRCEMGIWSVRKPDLAATLRRAALLLAAALGCAFASGAGAHDIPADVRITAFLKAADQRLEVLIRVPLAAMIEIDFPRRGPGFLDLARAEEALRGAAKLYLTDNITLYEDGAALPAPQVEQVRVSLADDASFGSYQTARAHLAAPPLPADLELYWSQQLLDVQLAYPIRSEHARFWLQWRVDRFGINVSTAMHVLLPGGGERIFEFLGDPGLLRLDPRPQEAAQQFFMAGFWYFLGHAEHLVFLLCLVLPLRGPRALALTLASFAGGLLISQLATVPAAPWFAPLIETLMAASIISLALENIVYGAQRRRGCDDAVRVIARRWMLAFGFGLLHGYAYALTLRELLQYAGEHLFTALLAFNAGVAVAQIAALLVLVAARALLFARVVADWLGTIILSALAIESAWDWMRSGATQLAGFPRPGLDAAFAASALGAALAALMLGGGVWLVSGALGRWLRRDAVAVEKPAA